MASYRAVMVGGPEDGRIMDMPGRWPTFEWRVPVTTSPVAGWLSESEPVTDMPTLKVLVYRLGVAEDGHPSIDDWGRYRYRYGGVRS